MKYILKAWFVLVSLFGVLAFAHASNVATFDFKVNPTKVQVGESIDIEITAIDTNGNVVKDYLGEIYVFVQERSEDTNLQFEHTFTAVNQWIYKIENGMKFLDPGKYNIIVVDNFDGDVSAYAEVEVVGNIKRDSGDISITSPQAGTTIPSTQVSVSGSTLPNHSVILTVNEEKISTSSNASGIFEVKVKDLKNGENVVIADVLDADDVVIGSSPQVFFEVAALSPLFKYILLNPDQDEYEPQTTVEVTVSATPKVKTEITFHGTTLTLTEVSSGTYTGEITTPEDADIYPIDVKLTGELGAITEEKWATSLTVVAPEPVEEPEVISEPIPVEEPPMLAAGVELDCNDFKKELDVTVRGRKEGETSILSWNKVDKASGYNVYQVNGSDRQLITKVTDPSYQIDITGDLVEFKNFVVTAVFQDDVCDVEGDESNMTKVQTGTASALLVLVALLGAGGAVYVIQRRKQA